MDPSLISLQGLQPPRPETGASGASASDAERIVAEGLKEAAAIGHPVGRARHRAAWALRLSALDPESAAAMAAEVADDPGEGVRVLLAVIEDRLRRGDADLEPHFTRMLELARGADPDTRVRALNALAEASIELAERDREAALALLRKLVPEVDRLADLGAEYPQPQALASALI